MTSSLRVLFFLLVSKLGFSQTTHKYVNYNVNDGLPSNSVFTAIQDQLGFMWFSTANGITYFDGYEFVKYSPDPMLADIEILKIFIREDGRMWLLPYGNGAFYIENDSVRRISDVSLERLFANSIAFSDDTTWFGSYNNGIVGIDFLKHATTTIDRKQLGSGCASVAFDDSGSLYIGINNGICKLINGKPECIRLPDAFFSKEQEVSLKFLKHNGLIAYTKHHVLEILHDTIKPVFAGNEVDHELRIQSINEDAKGNILIATNRGGIKLEDKGSKYYPERYLPEENVNMFYEDLEGNYWFTTAYHGVYFLGRSMRNILSFQKSGEVQFGNIQFLKALEKFPGKIFTGNSEGHLFILEGNSTIAVDLDKSRKTSIIHDVAASGNTLYIATTYGLFFNSLNNLTSDNDSIIYAPLGPLNEYTGDSVMTYTISNNFNFIRWNSPRTLEIDSADQLWFGANSGISRVTNELGAYNFTRFNRERIFRIKFDGEGKLYAATLTGLGMFNENGRINYMIPVNVKVNTKISHFDFDDNNNLWVGTLGQGLFAFGDDTVCHYTKNNLLLSDRIKYFQISNGYIYVAYTDAIDRFKLAPTFIDKNNTKRFELSSLLLSDEINKVHHQDSLLYIATNTGVTFLNENKYSKIESPPILNVKRIEIGNRSFRQPENFEIPYHSARFKIEYTGISFSSFKNIKFRYKLEGIDDSWTETRERSVEYPQLPAGNYAFVLSAKTAGSEWLDPVRIQLEVVPPFWKQSWFIILSLFLFVLITATVARWRVSSIRKRAKERIALNKRIAEFKLKALQAQMNPHFISNALASIQRYVSVNDGQKASGYLTKFSKLMRYVMESSINDNITLEDEIKLLSLYLELETLRFAGKVNYNIHYSPEVDPVEIDIPSMLIQPFVENAIIHGINPKGYGTVEVVFSKKENNLICIIMDDGSGMIERKEAEAMKKFPSRSTELINQRLETIRQKENKDIKISISNLPGNKGAKVEIFIPIE